MAGDVTAFLEERAIARGERGEVMRLVEERYAAEQPAVRVFDDETGQVVDLDYWDAAASVPASAPAQPRGRGRPSLGVVAREVTLLPRHWEWLAAQPGGASASLRRLVEAARKAPPAAGARRDAAYRFMADMCGDRPGYEEALRALYRGEPDKLEALIAPWPADVAAYIRQLVG
ncbi:MAG TPA: DUF2239 family protein [Allosphingosinicella sp.]|jgi:hypothetical protein